LIHETKLTDIFEIDNQKKETLLKREGFHVIAPPPTDHATNCLKLK